MKGYDEPPMHRCILMVLMLSVAGCKESAAPDRLGDPMPADPLAARTYLIERIGPVLDQTMCACCNKPLGQCFRETLSRQGPRCPDI